MNKKIYIFFVVVAILGWGCANTAHKKSQSESSKEVETALQNVTGALAGQEISSDELRDLVKDMQSNEETKSAVESIGQSLGVKKSDVKYCPVDGKRFDASIKDCPEHRVLLKEVE